MSVSVLSKVEEKHPEKIVFWKVVTLPNSIFLLVQSFSNDRVLVSYRFGLGLGV